MFIAITIGFLFFYDCASLGMQYGLPLPMAQELAQSLAQNLGIQWEPAARKPSMYMESFVFLS